MTFPARGKSATIRHSASALRYTGSRDHRSREGERSTATSPRRRRCNVKAAQTPQTYLDFDIWIEQKSEGLYRAKAWSGTAGFEATECFALPAVLTGGKLFLAGTGALRGEPGTALAASAADSPSPERLGGELFRAVFQGELLKAFQGCLARARSGPGLRIRLRLNDVPQLADLPWEYLHAEGQGFLALSARTPVVRYLELSEELGTLLV